MLRGKYEQFSGWVSYSYAKSTRSYPSLQNGKNFLFDGDQTHNFKSVVMLALNRDVTASVTFQLTSGVPKTWETCMVNHYTYDPFSGQIEAGSGYATPAKNNVRFPTRMQLEVGWLKKLRSGFGYRLAEYLGSDDATFRMTIQNILFLHRDPMFYFYLPDYGYYGLDPEFLPAVSAGYSIKF